MLEIGTAFLSLECKKEVDKKFSVNHPRWVDIFV